MRNRRRCSGDRRCGAKAVGKTGTFAVSPTIADAVHDAVDVRLFELPLTVEAACHALHAGAGDPMP